MEWLQKTADWLAAACKLFLCLALGVMTLVTFIEVTRRYFWGFSYVWAEELVRFMLVWVTFIGGSSAFRSNDLIFFDMLTSKVSERARRFFRLAVTLILFAVLGVFFQYGLNYALSRPVQFQHSPGLGLPMFYAYLSIPVGVGLMLYFNFCNLLRVLKEVKSGRASSCC